MLRLSSFIFLDIKREAKGISLLLELCLMSVLLAYPGRGVCKQWESKLVFGT